MEIKDKKYRHELKYNINKIQFEELKTRLSFLLANDEHTKEDGNYFIRSLYFDDYKETSYNQVLNGISEREKYRIRYYNNNTEYICLEKKYKVNNLVNKRICKVTKKQVEDLINNKLHIEKKNDILLNEFILKTKFYGYKPAVIIDYDRIPYVYKTGNVRITLDYNISIDYNTSNFFKTSKSIIPVPEENTRILEVKYNDVLPNYILWLININKLEQVAYSKYLNGIIMKKQIQ